ncbi:MAG: VIT1/CCC1 transporter family protein [Candidatus Gracilibacteria bacterium]
MEKTSDHKYTHHGVAPHKLQQGKLVKNIILGGQDGLVNVLGVILGVAAASHDVRIVIAGGLAATFAESISMGAVAYTSGMAEHDYYLAEKKKEGEHIEKIPQIEKDEIREIYAEKGFKGELLEQIVDTITKDKTIWLKTMMTEELNLSPVSRKELIVESFIVGFSAMVGSFVPLLPFFFLSIEPSIWIALVLSALTLFAVGAYKAISMVGNWWSSGLKLAVIGIIAALSGYGIGLIFQAPPIG